MRPDRTNPPKSWPKKYRMRAALGLHPAMGEPYADNGETCGTCAHFERHGRASKAYFKCGLLPYTRGAGTDIRSNWDACRVWESPLDIPEVTTDGG